MIATNLREGFLMSDNVFYCIDDERSFESLQDAVECIGEIASNLDDALGWVISVHKKAPTRPRQICLRAKYY